MADEKYTALENKVNDLASAFENFKVSMAKQIAEGFTKLSEAVKEEEKVVEEIKLTKKQNTVIILSGKLLLIYKIVFQICL